MHVHCLLFCAGNNTGWAGLGVGQIPTAQNWLLRKNDFQRYGYTHQPQTGMWKKDFLFFGWWVYGCPFSFFSFFFLDDDLHLNGRNCSLTDFSGNVYVKKNLKFLNCDQLSDISGNITVGKSLTCRRCSSLTDISGKINAGSQVHFGYCPRKGKKKGMCTLVDIFRGYILDTLIFTTNVYLPYFFYLWLS